MITNTGNTPLSNVVVVSDNGTPENPADDTNTPTRIEAEFSVTFPTSANQFHRLVNP